MCWKRKPHKFNIFEDYARTAAGCVEKGIPIPPPPVKHGFLYAAENDRRKLDYEAEYETAKPLMNALYAKLTGRR